MVGKIVSGRRDSPPPRVGYGAPSALPLAGGRTGQLTRDRRFSQQLLRLQDLVDKKEVCEQCTEMDRSIQVIDQLRADVHLGKNKMDRGERVASVTFQHSEKIEVAFGW